jgi:sugar/nucleoside kinase (ribokinase family)
MQVDVLTIGNALIDAFLTIHDANEHVQLDPKKKKFSVTAGEKVQLDSCIFELGGNACNVAVGLSRLGFAAGLMAEIGEDDFSETIIRRMTEEEVKTSLVQRKGQSSFAMGINFKGERTLFVQHVEREHKFSLTGVTAYSIYLTSMGQKWHHVYHMVRDYAKKHTIFLAMNPGTKQLSEGSGFIREMLPYTQVLFINRDEGFRLIGQESSKREVPSLLKALRQLGAETVVVTDGKNGSFVTDSQGNIYHSPVHHVPIVERTGAGDGYAVGFLAALLSGRDITEAMRWGSLNASSVIGKIGSQPGLLKRAEMERLLEDQEERITVKKID